MSAQAIHSIPLAHEACAIQFVHGFLGIPDVVKLNKTIAVFDGDTVHTTVWAKQVLNVFLGGTSREVAHIHEAVHGMKV